MGKYLFLAALGVFQTWFFYQLYKAWKEQKKLEQDRALIQAYIHRTFLDTK